MRYVLLCLACAGCGAARADGPPDLLAAPADVSARIAALEARVAELERRPLAPKVPHLIVAATGEDLGVSLGGDCAYSEKHGGAVCYATTAGLYYEGENCTGRAFVAPHMVKSISDRIVGISALYKPTGEPAAIIAYKSLGQFASRSCDAVPGMRSGVTALVEVGPSPYRPASDLALVPR